MKKLSEQISKNRNPDAELLRLIALLYQQLKNTKGKKVYGYLKRDTKKTVDLIFSRLARDETIRQMYSLWRGMEQTKHDVYSSARIDFPELPDNPVFRSVKNMIIRTVSGIDENQKQNQMLTDTALIIQSKIDSKLRRIIRRKKTELGIKEHLTPTQNYERHITD